jgi:hypothetical protein
MHKAEPQIIYLQFICAPCRTFWAEGIKMLFRIVIFILPVLFVITLVPGMLSVLKEPGCPSVNRRRSE